MSFLSVQILANKWWLARVGWRHCKRSSKALASSNSFWAAEIYRQLTGIAAIKEAVVIGQQWQGDVRVVLFVMLNHGHELTAELEKDIRHAIRTGASPRHVPAVIKAVADIPRTLSGKVVELAVRDIIHGKEVKNQSALANPEALALFEGFREG